MKKITQELLDRLLKEQKLLIQPREFDTELFRLAKIGLWAEENKDAIVSALAACKYGIRQIDYLETEEKDQIEKGAASALNTSIWSKE